MSSVRSELRKLRMAYPDADARVLARKFVQAHTKENLAVFIAEEIERLDRQTFTVVSSDAIRELRAHGQIEDWAPALREHICQIGNGSDELFGRMSAAQHRAKAAIHRMQAAGNIAKAELHEDAAAQIEAAGVACLDELGIGVEAAAA